MGHARDRGGCLNFCIKKMIEYVKCGPDIDVLRLLRKLEPDFPAQSVLLDIENLKVTPNKVFYDYKLYGILICRGWRSHRGELCLEIDHAIAEDAIEEHFSSILEASLWAWAFNNGFEKIYQHSHRPGLHRMLEKVYGPAKEHIFSKDLKVWAKDHLQAKQANQPAHPITE